MTYEAFIDQLESLLDELDEVEMTEELEELNANFEDVLFMLSESDGDADELDDAADELQDIAAAYRAIPETAVFGDRLAAIVAQFSPEK